MDFDYIMICGSSWENFPAYNFFSILNGRHFKMVVKVKKYWITKAWSYIVQNP